MTHLQRRLPNLHRAFTRYTSDPLGSSSRADVHVALSDKPRPICMLATHQGSTSLTLYSDIYETSTTQAQTQAQIQSPSYPRKTHSL
jgi:hypothetical protein